MNRSTMFIVGGVLIFAGFYFLQKKKAAAALPGGAIDSTTWDNPDTGQSDGGY